jgi:hypothetical protein
VILIVSLSIYHDQAKCQAYNACSHVSKSLTAAISFSLAKKNNKICFIKENHSPDHDKWTMKQLKSLK